MRDSPSGPALLALARDVLLDDLIPLLPQEKRLDALLVANCIAIAKREAGASDGPMWAIIRELQMFYRGVSGGEVEPEALPRFAHDLRSGAFEDSEARDRDARAILWRLTIAKLRLANPRFLAANGLA